jgi:hypothetical protein
VCDDEVTSRAFTHPTTIMADEKQHHGMQRYLTQASTTHCHSLTCSWPHSMQMQPALDCDYESCPCAADLYVRVWWS